MRYSRDHKQETHNRIVQKASERFRAEGVDAVGVASLMQSVGLTVGGFYAHFGSKEDLIAEACSSGFAGTIERFRAYIDSKPKGEKMASLVDAYLSKRHRDDPAQGCVIAANGAELARHPVPTRAAFSAELGTWVALIEQVMREDGVRGDARSIISTMVGAIVLARAVDDSTLSDAFLTSARQSVLGNLIHVS
ncbi:MAG TPA: TetR/AcrR family transcriptional regulator [Noviherbaspirillum sp.]